MTNQTLQTISQAVVALGILFTALGGLGTYIFGQRVQHEKEAAQRERVAREVAQQTYVGRLQTEPKIILSEGKQVYPKLEFGDSGSILLWAGPQGKPIINFAEDNNLTIELLEDQLLVSTKIRDRNGTIVAEISRNEWKVNPSKSWDRNYTKNALEVRDPSGDIVLQIRLVEDRVQLQAKMYDSEGTGVAFYKTRGPEGWAGTIQKFDSDNPFTGVIQPIFKYPSDLNLGELRQNPAPSSSRRPVDNQGL
jgi:hypothetical protein